MGRATITESLGDGKYWATVEWDRRRLEAELAYLEQEIAETNERLSEAQVELDEAEYDLGVATDELHRLIGVYAEMTSGLTRYINNRARAISEIY